MVKGNRLRNKLIKWTTEQGFLLSAVESWRGKSSIGLDPKNNIIALLNEDKGKAKFDLIDLEEIRVCRAIKVYNGGADEESIEGPLRKIMIELHYLDETRQHTIEVYDMKKQPKLSNEWSLAQQWTERINRSILIG
ncbi:hypothetical protein GCM10007049_28320 [Echinicola pacifica]|uniref:Uncharacterized protein n=2 Tax=Echinicola pacifica TaxID=346377 RepID=A0A918UTI2_9BACT|nr:hypothetical protein GCM10007049_28320 [Echinicola pacifica]